MTYRDSESESRERARERALETDRDDRERRCRCERPVPSRYYLGVGLCALCQRPIYREGGARV